MVQSPMTIEGFVRKRKIAREAVRTVDREAPEPLARYLAQIGQGRLLTHEEEIDLARRESFRDVPKQETGAPVRGS